MQNLLTIFHDHPLVQDYHSEYLKLINYYSNVTRNSVFVKYYNINILSSIYDQKMDSTYDIYHTSKVKFDIYDITPAFYLQPIQNRSSNVTDLKGQMMDGTTSIVIYSIERPKIHDIVVFYAPMERSEFFRVVNVTVPSNAIHSTPSVNFFELELEYAPLNNLNDLKIANHYVYDLSDEKYREHSEYQTLMSTLDRIVIIFDELYNYYNSEKDLYVINGKIPLATNEVIIYLKRQFYGNYKRLFEKYKLPYAYIDIIGEDLYYNSLDELPFKDLTNNLYHVYNLETEQIEEYVWVNKDNPKNEIEQSLYHANNLWLEMKNPLN